MKLTKVYLFEAAHFLPYVPDGHKCKSMHGHSYKVLVSVSGPIRQDGFVIDFKELSEHAKGIIMSLDHKVLNEVEGLSNPTSENLCAWLWEHIIPVLPRLVSIEVRETSTSRCKYTGPE